MGTGYHKPPGRSRGLFGSLKGLKTGELEPKPPLSEFRTPIILFGT
jgi:hypothetical protein